MSNWQDLLWKLLPVLSAFGVLIAGSWLTSRSHRREWIADNKKEEYRKVLGALNNLNKLLIDQHGKGGFDLHVVEGSLDELTMVLNTSLFIYDFLDDTKIVHEVANAVTTLLKTGDLDTYTRRHWKAVNTIRASAKQIKS